MKAADTCAVGGSPSGSKLSKSACKRGREIRSRADIASAVDAKYAPASSFDKVPCTARITKAKSRSSSENGIVIGIWEAGYLCFPNPKYAIVAARAGALFSAAVACE
jgi:hypothetical protein